jgi:hypothetical protein
VKVSVAKIKGKKISRSLPPASISLHTIFCFTSGFLFPITMSTKIDIPKFDDKTNFATDLDEVCSYSVMCTKGVATTTS